MLNSRKLEDLLPQVKSRCEAFISMAEMDGIDVLVTSTYRDNESQAALYAQGRTTPGPIVTNAKAGQSFHNYRVAFDVVPLVKGKPIWNDNELWKRLGEIGTEAGLEWAGNWKSFKEMAHFQFTDGLTLNDFQIGRSI